VIRSLERWYLARVRDDATPTRLRAALTFGGAFVREAVNDQLLVRSATLAYWSLVGIVPVLVVIAAALQPFGGTESVRNLLYSSLLAGPVRAVGTQLDTWLAQVDFAKLGVAGLIGTLVTASRVYTAAEEAYNHLWRCNVRRSWITRMVMFYAILTVVPVLVAYGFHLSSSLRPVVGLGLLRRVLPAVTTAVAFGLAIRTLPDTRVRWMPAAVGGAFSAVLFEGAKAGFGAYTDVLGAQDAAAAVYGSLALFPVFLLWLFVLWVTVLLGVEMAYVVQNLPELVRAEQRLHEGGRARQADAFFAVQCAVVVTRRWLAGQGASDALSVTRALGTEPAQVQAALLALAAAGILVETEGGMVLAGPPEGWTARDVVGRYRALSRPAGAEDGNDGTLPDRLLGPAADRTLAALAREADAPVPPLSTGAPAATPDRSGVGAGRDA
jgi:YihY family inner membrane protein